MNVTMPARSLRFIDILLFCCSMVRSVQVKLSQIQVNTTTAAVVVELCDIVCAVVVVFCPVRSLQCVRRSMVVISVSQGSRGEGGGKGYSCGGLHHTLRLV